jgi:uncharacterized protein
MEFQNNAKWRPEKLDVRAFAQALASLSGQSPLSDWPRLAEEAQSELQAPPVSWTLRGEWVPESGAPDQVWLHLHIQATLPMLCQRCLGPVLTPIEVDRPFRFVADEDTAMALDDELEEDLLVLSREFDALALIEDEVILAVPLVPFHEVCPVPLTMTVSDPQFEAAETERPNPFAALAGLKIPPSR